MLDQTNRQQNLEARITYLERRIRVLEQSIATDTKLRDQFQDEQATLQAEMKAITDGPTDTPAG